MNHEMGLFPKNFEKIKLGQKRREYRLYDEKRQKIVRHLFQSLFTRRGKFFGLPLFLCKKESGIIPNAFPDNFFSCPFLEHHN